MQLDLIRNQDTELLQDMHTEYISGFGMVNWNSSGCIADWLGFASIFRQIHFFPLVARIKMTKRQAAKVGTLYSLEDVVDLCEVSIDSTFSRTYWRRVAISSEHPCSLIRSKRKVRLLLFSSMYVTAPISGQRITLVWSLKKLIWKK